MIEQLGPVQSFEKVWTLAGFVVYVFYVVLVVTMRWAVWRANTSTRAFTIVCDCQPVALVGAYAIWIQDLFRKYFDSYLEGAALPDFTQIILAPAFGWFVFCVALVLFVLRATSRAPGKANAANIGFECGVFAILIGIPFGLFLPYFG